MRSMAPRPNRPSLVFLCNLGVDCFSQCFVVNRT